MYSSKYILVVTHNTNIYYLYITVYTFLLPKILCIIIKSSMFHYILNYISESSKSGLREIFFNLQ